MPLPPPSRRDLLRTGSALAGAVALGACGGSVAGPAPKARATATPTAGAVHLLDQALVVEHTTLYAYSLGVLLFGDATAPLATSFRHHNLDRHYRLISLLVVL